MTKRAIALAIMFLGACRGSTQSVDGRSNFVEDGVAREAPADWLGERIEIVNVGVTPSGGLAMSTPHTSRVTATARMLAVADTLDKPSADQTIMSATNTYGVNTSDGVTAVACARGMTFGSADSDESGCDALDVAVPSGDPKKLLSVLAKSGNGKVVVVLDDDVQLAQLDVHASHGFIDALVPTTKGAAITIVSETGDDITLRLSSDFAADSIVLDTSPDKLDTTAFSDVTSGKPRGKTGTGAQTITVRTGVDGGLRGRIVLVVR